MYTQQHPKYTHTHMSIFVAHPEALSFTFGRSICCLFYSYVFIWLLIRARVASFSSLSLLLFYMWCVCVFHSRLFVYFVARSSRWLWQAFFKLSLDGLSHIPHIHNECKSKARSLSERKTEKAILQLYRSMWIMICGFWMKYADILLMPCEIVHA